MTSTGSIATDPPAQPESADLSAWLAVAAGTLGAFMATLDISIVNSSLPTIQGEIGATPSEGTWIGTTYLVAEIIITPLTAWLGRMLGLRRFMLIAAAMFTIFSMLCGFSYDLPTMIVGRLGQGLAGGTLIPVALTIVATRLPQRQQALGIALFGATALLGPVTGPLIGGWITEAFSWHYAFFINLPFCILLMALLLIGLPAAAGDRHELRNADWAGIAGLSIWLGSLTILFEEGHREQWFESQLIWRLAIAAAAGFAILVWSSFHASRPVIKFALLRRGPLAVILVMMLMMGALLFGTSYIIPQFLAAVAGYNAFQSGQVAFISGITAASFMFVFPTISRVVDPRLVIVVGCLAAATSSFLASGLTPQSDGGAFTISQLIFGAGISMVTFSLQQAAVTSVSMEDAGEASGLFMAARNLGGSVGLAVIASIQDERLEFHRWQIHGGLGANDLSVQSDIAQKTADFGGGADGLQAAYQALDGQVTLNALVMSFNDVFLLLAVGVMVVMPLAIFIRRRQPGSVAVLH